MNLDSLERFNPWWKTGRVREEWLRVYKRQLYQEIFKYVDKRQIILVQGLRRVGKTTLMFQIIQELLNQIDQKNILYFSFDEFVLDAEEVLETYQKLILGKTFEEEKNKTYIFFDEVHKIANWENKLKVYYDLYPNLKFFVSGSASVNLRKRAKESLAGRIFDFTLDPLNFEEFLELKGKDLKKIKSQPQLWKREVLPLFYKYIKFGSFPELVNEENEELARKYIINNVIERIIYKDLPEEFKIKDTELLKTLVYLIGQNPGMLINYKELAKNLGRDQRTISNYFEYLEFGLLTKFVLNYRGSPLASLRKMKKIYFTTPNIAFAINPEIERVLPKLLENIVLIKTDAKFFYRDGYEVDFVLIKDKQLIAIEVKSEYAKIKQLKKFIEKFGKKVKKAFIVDFEHEGKKENIKIIPAWKFLLSL